MSSLFRQNGEIVFTLWKCTWGHRLAIARTEYGLHILSYTSTPLLVFCCKRASPKTNLEIKLFFALLQIFLKKVLVLLESSEVRHTSVSGAPLKQTFWHLLRSEETICRDDTPDFQNGSKRSPRCSILYEHQHPKDVCTKDQSQNSNSKLK